MSSINKHFNHDYDGGSPDLPHATGDRYYAQDLGLDFEYLRQLSGLTVKDMINGVVKIIGRGLIASQTSGPADTLDITAGVAYAPYSVKQPTDAALPPTIAAVDCEMTRITVLSNLTSIVPSSPTLDNTTWNYIKIAYSETDNAITRARARASGTYSPWRDIGYTITCSSVAPTDYEVCLGEFKGLASGTWTFRNLNRTGYIETGSMDKALMLMGG